MPRIVAGLDVGSTKTCAVIVDPCNGPGEDCRPEVLGVGTAVTEGVRNRTVASIEAATESIRAALRDAEQMAGVEVLTRSPGRTSSNSKSKTPGVKSIGPARRRVNGKMVV